MTTNELTQAPVYFREMPLDIAAIIRDEAQLRLARETLEEEVKTAEARLAAARSVGSWWAFLTRPLYRKELYRRRINEEQTHHQWKQLLKQVKALQRRITPPAPLRAIIAQRLGNLDDSYRRGLRASRYHEFWRRRHTLARDRHQVFLKELSHGLTSVRSDMGNDRKSLSTESRHAIELAGQAAAELDEQISALNLVCDSHREAVNHSPFSEVFLPRLAPWHCVRTVAPLLRSTPREAEEHLRAMQEDYQINKSEMLSHLDTLFRDAASLHSSVAEHYLTDAWHAMIRHAECYWVEDRDIQELVAEIESRQTEAERARWVREISHRDSAR